MATIKDMIAIFDGYANMRTNSGMYAHQKVKVELFSFYESIVCLS